MAKSQKKVVEENMHFLEHRNKQLEAEVKKLKEELRDSLVKKGKVELPNKHAFITKIDGVFYEVDIAFNLDKNEVQIEEFKESARQEEHMNLHRSKQLSVEEIMMGGKRV